jgi:predicted glutamine amidotransferase
MCGIAGWNLTEKPGNEFFSTLAATMQGRGEQAWGVFHAGEINKGTGTILEGISAGRIASLAGFLHTRHATHGDVVASNSHPFEIGNLIGAHNGVLSNHKELNAKYSRSFDVDSMHIFQHITDGLSLEEIKGYGAIEFYRDGAFFVGCCNGGELEVALTNVGCIWASTRDAIDFALAQADLKLIHYYHVDAGELYRIEADGMYATNETFKMSERRKDAKKWDDYGTSANSTTGWQAELTEYEAIADKIAEEMEVFSKQEFSLPLQDRLVAISTERSRLEDKYWGERELLGTSSDDVPTDGGGAPLGGWHGDDREWCEMDICHNDCDLCGENRECANYQGSYICERCF